MAVDLKEYLKSVYELESVLEASMMLEREYSNTLVTLGRPMKLVEPCEPEKGKVDTQSTKDKVKNGFKLLIISLIGAIVDVGLYFLICSLEQSGAIYLNGSVWGFLLCAVSLIVLFGLAILSVLGVLGSLVMLITGIPTHLINAAAAGVSENKSHKNALSKYHDDVAEYEKAKSKEEERLYGERAIAASLRIKRDELTTANEQLRNSLARLYDMDILHDSFRNKKAVERLYYYIDTRICYQLEGDKGAYLRYQDDLRTEAIIGAIDNFRRSVEQRLDTIIRNQRAVLAELRTANIAIQSMKEALDETNNRLYQVDQKLSSLERQQITANDYLNRVSSTLDSVVNAQEIDRMNTYAIAMNQYHSLVQHNAEDMYLVRPYH